MKVYFTSKRIKDTIKIAKWVSKNLNDYKVICLSGDLGAGKTTFTKSLFKALGVKEIVSSPTFTIVKNYHGKKLDIFHLDLYRVSDEDELRELGLEEILSSGALVVIEWPQIANSYLPKKYLNINITFNEDCQRVFEIEEKYEK